jgi:hypothetical protein
LFGRFKTLAKRKIYLIRLIEGGIMETYTALAKLTYEFEFEIEANSPEEAEALAMSKALDWQPVNQTTDEVEEWSEIVVGVD